MMASISSEDLKVNFIQTSKGKIATYSIGEGQPVIFLHGGPGDTHHYMRRMAGPLVSKFHCRSLRKTTRLFPDPSQVARDRRAPLNEQFLSNPYVAQPSRSPLALVTGKINRVF